MGQPSAAVCLSKVYRPANEQPVRTCRRTRFASSVFLTGASPPGPRGFLRHSSGVQWALRRVPTLLLRLHGKRLLELGCPQSGQFLLLFVDGRFQLPNPLLRFGELSLLRDQQSDQAVGCQASFPLDKAAGLQKLEKAEALTNDALRTAPKYQPARKDLRGVTTLRNKMERGGP